MRDFFLNLLNNLDKLAGLKQLDKIYAVHGNDILGAKKEIKILLDVLCNVSNQFPFIPEDDQQKIITQAVISEEFHSLNGNTLYKWLARHKDKYYREAHHEKKEETAEPLTGEARAAALKKWLDSLANTQQMIIAKKVDAEKEGKEWVSEIERKAVSVIPDPDRNVYTIEQLKARNERIRAMQEKSFRERNPGASEDEVKLFMEDMKRFEIKIPEQKESKR
jgi:hypothetical protein